MILPLLIEKKLRNPKQLTLAGVIAVGFSR